MANISVNMPTAKDLEDAHEEYLEKVSAHFAYRLATEQMRAGRPALGIILLLIVWNGLRARDEHFEGIQRVLRENRPTIAEFAERSISSVTNNDEMKTKHLFEAFDNVHGIGPVGAAKSMHLLAPDFFPLWDSEIAKEYGRQLQLSEVAKQSADGYWAFMKATKRQYDNVEGEWRLDVGLLKLLDEYNYCKYKRHVI